MKPTGDILGRQKEAEWENLRDLIKGKMIDTYFFYIGEYKIVNSQQLT